MPGFSHQIMKRLLQSLLAFSLSGSSLNAETRVVLTGASIQEQIDAAVDGDIIAIFGGTYAQDVVINKKVRLVELAGQDVHITGNVTFDSVEDCPPFQGFKVGSDNKGILIVGAQPTTGLVIKDVETDSSSRGIIIDAKENDVSIVGGVHSNLEQGGGSLVVNSTIILRDFVTLAPALKTIGFRVSVTGRCIWNGDSSKSWLGYSSSQGFLYSGAESRVVLVANTFDTTNDTYSVNFGGRNNNFTLVNSRLHVAAHGGRNWDDPRGKAIFVSGGGHSARISNNYIQQDLFSPSRDHYIVTVTNEGNITIENNHIHRISSRGYGGYGFNLIHAPFGVKVNSNHISASATITIGSFAAIVGGVTETNRSTGDALLVDDNPYDLQVESPLVDGGSNDPRYNDLDGTRNNIGPSGGSWYDPEGWTTENPVVISFDLSPEQALGGVTNEVEVSEIQAISAP